VPSCSFLIYLFFLWKPCRLGSQKARSKAFGECFPNESQTRSAECFPNESRRLSGDSVRKFLASVSRHLDLQRASAGGAASGRQPSSPAPSSTPFLNPWPAAASWHFLDRRGSARQRGVFARQGLSRQGSWVRYQQSLPRQPLLLEGFFFVCPFFFFTAKEFFARLWKSKKKKQRSCE